MSSIDAPSTPRKVLHSSGMWIPEELADHLNGIEQAMKDDHPDQAIVHMERAWEMIHDIGTQEALEHQVSVGLASLQDPSTAEQVLSHYVTQELFNNPANQLSRSRWNLVSSWARRDDLNMVELLMQHTLRQDLNIEVVLAVNKGKMDLAITMLPWCDDTMLDCMLWKLACNKPLLTDALIAQATPNTWKVMNSAIEDQHPVVHAVHERDAYLVNALIPHSDAVVLEKAAMVALGTNQMEIYQSLKPFVVDSESYTELRDYLNVMNAHSMQEYWSEHIAHMSDEKRQKCVKFLLYSAIEHSNVDVISLLFEHASDDDETIKDIEQWADNILDDIGPQTHQAAARGIEAFRALVMKCRLGDVMAGEMDRASARQPKI